jgi:hypothetical protein
LRAAALAIGAALLLAGCGEHDTKSLTKAEYERTLQGTVGSLNTELLQVGTPAQIQPEAAADRIETIQEHFRNAASRLDGVEPPGEVRSAHEQLVEGLREFAEDLDEGREAAESGDAEELREFQEELSRAPSARKLRRALGRIQDAGYSPGL